jgi:hypothetical protein
MAPGFLLKAEMICADEVIGNQLTSGDGTFRTSREVRLESGMRKRTSADGAPPCDPLTRTVLCVHRNPAQRP